MGKEMKNLEDLFATIEFQRSSAQAQLFSWSEKEQ